MKNVDVELHCLGYYGFGGGYAKTKDAQQLVTLTGGQGKMYCTTCPQRIACWDMHVEVAEAAFPQAMKEYSLRATTMSDAELAASWQRDFKCPDPLISLMLNNMEDGIAVASGFTMPDRGERTLPWPFRVK